MAGKRKTHTAAFKAQVALAAVLGDRTVNELALQFGIHPTLIHGWKKQLRAGAEEVFANGSKTTAADAVVVQAQLYEQIAQLYEQIGRLKMELEWLKKKLPASAEVLRALVDPDHAPVSISRQCALLGLSRASFHYQAATETEENLRLMHLLDAKYTRHPFYGSRKLTRWLHEQGEEVNRKRVQRLLRLMGPEAI